MKEVIDTGRFDYEAAANSAGWMRELEGEHTPETEEYGISSFIYRARRPFDAAKLMDAFSAEELWDGVLRSKGFFWVSAAPHLAYEWSQAGGAANVEAGGQWYAATDPADWELEGDERPDEQPNWDPTWGDRIQELVFIGQGLEEPSIRAKLDACLVPDDGRGPAELAAAAGPNPFAPANELVN